MKGVFIIMMKITKIGQSKPDPFNNNSKSSRHDKQPIHIIIHNHHHTFGQQQQQMQKINFNLTDQPISNKTKKNCAFFHMKSRFCCWSTIFFVAPFFFDDKIDFDFIYLLKAQLNVVMTPPWLIFIHLSLDWQQNKRIRSIWSMV